MVSEERTRDRLSVGRSGPEADDLTRIRGVSAGLARRLVDRGVVRFAQIAAWSADDVRTIAANLELGREISRGNWIEQAALLELRRGAAPRPAVGADTRAVELHHVLQHIRTAAGVQGVPSPAEAAAGGTGGAASAPAVEHAQPARQERQAETPEALHGGENLVRPALEPEEASVTFVIRKPAPVPPGGGATAHGVEGQVTGPPSQQWVEGGIQEPLLASLDSDGEEAEVVIVSRRTPKPRSRRA
jgi:hypothetical protein